MLCRYGDQRFEDDPMALVRIVHGDFGAALWRPPTDNDCGEFHRRAGGIVAGTGKPETFRANGITLLYDDPRHPLPGTVDLLEAP
ncbi:hypothetical protein OG548_45810 [Streptomyces sp. NBC_01356]|uniref:hypothetical protein n=1 Tax=Streptomyces sp. NBC_01356 TaxID=2903836 RepID=UPI002E37C6FA|nr:hypothetical protein [Streptomyces sp. NBC_01356]